MQQSNLWNSKTGLLLKTALFCIFFTTCFWLASFFKSFFPSNAERLTHGIIGTLVAALVTLVFLKWDKLTFADIGLRFRASTIPNFFKGWLAGLLIMGSLTAIVIATSGFKVVLNPNSGFLSFIMATFPLVLLAYMEELAFRGYPLAIWKNKLDTRVALLVTSLFFALYHIANGWSVQSSLLGPWPWGIIFGLAAWYSNGIAMPAGLHYGVNLVTAAFGVQDQSSNLWILQKQTGESLENYQSSTLETLLPQIGMIVFAVVLMEILLRRKMIR